MTNIKLNDIIEDFTFNKIFIELIRLYDRREIWLDNNILFDNACNGIKDSTDIDKDISDHYETAPSIDIRIKYIHCYTRKVWNNKHTGYEHFNESWDKRLTWACIVHMVIHAVCIQDNVSKRCNMSFCGLEYYKNPTQQASK